MAELPEVVPGEPIDSTSFGNPVLDRVLSRYADATQRDALTPLPVAGDFAYLINIGATQVFDGLAWSTLAVGTDYLALTGGVLSGDLDLNDNTLRNANLGAGTIYNSNIVDSVTLTQGSNVWQDTGAQITNLDDGGYLIIAQAYIETTAGSSDTEYGLQVARADNSGIDESFSTLYGSVVNRGKATVAVITSVVTTGEVIKLRANRSNISGATEAMRRIDFFAISVS